MNIQNLLKYLKNDLNELAEILTELAPRQELSVVEVKLIKSRIRSLTEEFEMLENEVELSKQKIEVFEEKQQQKTPEITATPSAKEELPSLDLPETNEKPVPKPQDTLFEEPKIENTAQQVEEIVHEENQKQTIDEDIDYQETLAEDDSQQECIENVDEPIANIVEQPASSEVSPPKKTIADKYEGSSSSLHERIASLVEQKDLASKLQQNPIEDLTKAIKLNDKIWFIKTLFNDNANLYKETILKVNQMNELDEALHFLEKNFQFNQQEESFKSFFELIYRRFLN